MRPSPLRHPLAILRSTIGLTQKEMGDLVGRAARTIQAVELGNLPLSEDLAILIAQATGVHVSWLLDGDTSVPPRKSVTTENSGTGPGNPYTKADFEFHRAFLESPASSPEEIQRAIHDACKHGNPEDPEFVTLPLAVFKGTIVNHKKRVLASFDHELVRALNTLLQKTVGTASGDLVRWKIRRTLQTLADDNSLDVQLPASPSPILLNVAVKDETSKTPTRRRKTKARSSTR